MEGFMCIYLSALNNILQQCVYDFSHLKIASIDSLANFYPSIEHPKASHHPYLSFYFQQEMAASFRPATLASTAAANTNGNDYHDVFINHRGLDVKKTFASHLYYRLHSCKLRVFLDQQELQGVNSFPSEIEDAIRTASVHVAIFSPRYAESERCLNELLLILESGAPVIPVYYHVRPAELLMTLGENGSYARAINNHQKGKTDDPLVHRVEKWRKALSCVADIRGYELDAYNGDEGELLERVVQRVFKTVKTTRLKVGKYLDDKLKDFENTVLLRQHTRKPQVVGIVGLGGVGKTTLAKEFFNRRCSYYRRSCFLCDVRENAYKASLNLLQRRLLKSLTGSDLEISNIHDGIERLKEHLPFSEALVILDDVDNVNQIEALLPGQSEDSLILITCRNKNVFRSRVDESAIYNLTGLSSQHSRELFCSYAFSRPRPFLGFGDLVDKFLKECHGLPLSLKVLGALLSGNYDRSFWEDQLDSLQQILPTEIERILKISYDALNKEEQQIFLDIACFFTGNNKNMALRIWNGSGWKGWLGFQNLQRRCLVEVDGEKNIRMHDHLREMGRKIANASEMRRLFWHKTPSDDLLPQSTVLTKVRGVAIVPGDYNNNDNNDEHSYLSLELLSERRFCIQTLQLLDINARDCFLEPFLRSLQLPNLIWLRWHKCPHTSLPSWIPMGNLRVLELQGKEFKILWQTESQVPLQLRELIIRAPLSKLPQSIWQLKHLESIYLEETNIEALPEEFGNLCLLMALNLVRCSKIMALPDSFGNLTNLQHINLSHAHSLQMLPRSFGNLIRLEHLNLRACSNLTMSNEALGNISTLVYLDLSHCKKIELLPYQVAHQWSLRKLCLWDTNLKKLPGAIGELSDLEHLILQSPWLEMLPPSLGDLRNLKELTLWDCKELRGLPDSVGLLTELTELTVVGCPLRELPIIKVEDETQTESLVELSWRETSEESRGLCGLAKLRILNISRCSELEELPSIETLVSLEVLRASDCVKLKKIRGMKQLTKLRVLDVVNCSELEDLPGVEHLRSLEKIYTSGCPKLQRGGGRLLWISGAGEDLFEESGRTADLQ